MNEWKQLFIRYKMENGFESGCHAEGKKHMALIVGWFSILFFKPVVELVDNLWSGMNQS